ncbi:MAG: repeat-containing protein, partial [Verrucomicrobiaceae bacterium]|nr:repeat-containing protein [Verrucomicrobiaceae bacterium]
MASAYFFCLPAQAQTAPSFGTPTQYTSGGQTIVKVASSLRTPSLDANSVDTGADTVSYLDINNDGTTGDFVTADHNTQLIRVHMAPPAGGTVYTNYDLNAANPPTDLSVADVNGDGLPDIITCENGNIVVYLNTTNAGTVNFSSGTNFTAKDENGGALAVNKVTVADTDNDGLPDLIGVGTLGAPSTSSRVQVVVLRNTSSNQSVSFAASVVYGAPGSGDFVMAANLTRNASGGAVDSYPEIIVGSNNGDFTNGNTHNSGHGSYSIFLNKGNGTYGSDTDSTASARPHQTTTYDHINGMAVGDVTADGNRDLVIEEGQITGDGTGQTFIQLFSGNGDGTVGGVGNGYPTSTGYVCDNHTGIIFQGDVVLGDFNGDGNVDVAVTDPLRVHGVIVFALDPAADPSSFFPYSTPGNLEIPTAAGAQAIGVTDINGDGLPDLLVANNDTNNLSLLLNTGVAPFIPPVGRNVIFGTPSVVTNITGDIVTIPVIRGRDSSGQVLSYFTVSGTAVPYASAAKPNDFQFIQPSGTQQEVTFPAPPDPAANVQNIVIKLTPTKVATLKTITLSLLEPVGYADIGTPSTITIPLASGHPGILKAPTGLAVTPTNFFAVPAYTGSPSFKVGFTGSDWNFAALEPVVLGATDLAVTIETAPDPHNGPWTTLLPLTGKSGKWTGSTRDLPTNFSLVYFRAHATATGFTDAVSAPSTKFGVSPGPELSLNVAADTSSDGSGHSIHISATAPSEQIIYHVTIANVGESDASNVVVNFPIPPHTTWASVTNTHGVTHNTLKSGKVSVGGWTFATIPKGTIYHEDLKVNLDLTSAFSTSDPTKGYGYIVKATGFTASGTIPGFISGKPPVVTATTLVKEFDTQILGPISMDISSDVSTAKPGDIITYTIHAYNNSTSPLTLGVVQDHIPAGTLLETLYATNSSTDASSSSQALPNPGAFSNPQIIYARNPNGASIDLSFITDPQVLIFAVGFLKAKPTTEYDFVATSAQAVAKGADASKFASAVTELINAQVFLPVAVKWPVPTIAAKGNITIKFQVRVIYDLLKVSQTNPDGVPATIANSNYDFTIAAGGKTLSALYGTKAAPLSTALNLAPATAQPIIGLSKYAYGDHTLNNPARTGNGSQLIAGLGQVTTAVQHRGFDYELHYRNTGVNDAHNIVIHEVIPAGAALRGNFTQSINGSAASGMVAEQLSYYDAAGSLIPTAAAASNYDKVKSMDIRLGAFNNLSPLKGGDSGTIRYTIEPTLAPAVVGKPPVFIQSLGGYDSTLNRSNPLQGAYITCSDLATPVPALPDSLLVKIIADASFDIHYTKGAYNGKPLDYVPFDFTLIQLGDATAANTTVNLVIPAGVTLATATNTDTNHKPVFSDGTAGGPTVTITGQNATLGFGSMAGHQTHTFRLYLQINSINGNLDPVLKARHRLYFDTDPPVTYNLVVPSAASTMSVTSSPSRSVQAVTKPVTLTSVATSKQAVQVSDSTAAHLSVSRSSPYTVNPGDTFKYEIAFSNSGDLDATNVTVGMQIPYFTHFVSTTSGTITISGQTTRPNTNVYTTKMRTAAQVKATGPGPDIITWPFGTLPAH